LIRRILLAGAASLAVLLAGLVGILLYIRPSLVGVGPAAAADYQGRWIWLAAGLFLEACGAAFLYIALRWPLQLKRVVTSTRAQPMSVYIDVEEDSASTTCFAVIAPPGCSPAWRAQLWVYPPGIKQTAGQPCQCAVYFHPRLGRPAAVQHPLGMLWVIAGSGAVTRLD
jgi:hypothetical protein